MVAWETMSVDGEPPSIRDYTQIWQAADKIVYSKTLESVTSGKTRIERDFDTDVVRNGVVYLRYRVD